MKTHIMVPTILLAALMLALSACSSSTPEGAIAPCTPVDGTSNDPCALGPSLTRSGSGESADPGTSPWSIRTVMEGHGDSGFGAIHLVVRATYLPGTVRCVPEYVMRAAPYTGLRDIRADPATGVALIQCYADVRANEYIVGSGPATLTIVAGVIRAWWETLTPEQTENLRADGERALNTGAEELHLFDVPRGGIVGREAIMYLGPALNYGVESWQVFEAWNIQRNSDNTPVVVHPFRDYFLSGDAGDVGQFRNQVEMTLSAFRGQAASANMDRMNDYDGRVAAAVIAPMLVTSNAGLHQHYVDVGAMDHADGPPKLPPPP